MPELCDLCYRESKKERPAVGEFDGRPLCQHHAEAENLIGLVGWRSYRVSAEREVLGPKPSAAAAHPPKSNDPEPYKTIVETRRRGRIPGSKNKPKVTGGNGHVDTSAKSVATDHSKAGPKHASSNGFQIEQVRLETLPSPVVAYMQSPEMMEVAEKLKKMSPIGPSGDGDCLKLTPPSGVNVNTFRERVQRAMASLKVPNVKVRSYGKAGFAVAYRVKV